MVIFYILLLDWPIKSKHPLITMSHNDKLAVYFKHIKPFQAHIAYYTLHDSSKAYLDQKLTLGLEKSTTRKWKKAYPTFVSETYNVKLTLLFQFRLTKLWFHFKPVRWILWGSRKKVCIKIASNQQNEHLNLFNSTVIRMVLCRWHGSPNTTSISAKYNSRIRESKHQHLFNFLKRLTALQHVQSMNKLLYSSRVYLQRY